MERHGAWPAVDGALHRSPVCSPAACKGHGSQTRADMWVSDRVAHNGSRHHTGVHLFDNQNLMPILGPAACKDTATKLGLTCGCQLVSLATFAGVTSVHLKP